MTIKSKLTLAIAVVALLFVVGWTSRAQQSSKNNWEYKAVTLLHNADIVNPNLQQLNDIGDEGWELVAVIPSEVQHGNIRQSKITCYFKRPL